MSGRYPALGVIALLVLSAVVSLTQTSAVIVQANVGCPDGTDSFGSRFSVGDCLVDVDTNWGNGTYTIAGDVIVGVNARLTLWNMTLRLDPASDQQYRILLNDGELVARGGTITTNNTDYNWRLETGIGSSVLVDLNGANISFAGGGSYSGFRLLGGTVHRFRNLTVSNSAINTQGEHGVVSLAGGDIHDVKIENSTFSNTGTVVSVVRLGEDPSVVFRDNLIKDFNTLGGPALNMVDMNVINNTFHTGTATAIHSWGGGGPGWPNKNDHRISGNTIYSSTEGSATRVIDLAGDNEGYDLTGNRIQGRVLMSGQGHFVAYNNFTDFADVPSSFVLRSGSNSTVRHNTWRNITLDSQAALLIGNNWGNVTAIANTMYLKCAGPNCMAIETLDIQEGDRAVYPGFPTVEISWNNITWTEIGVGDWAITFDNEFSRRLYIHNNTQQVTATEERVGNCLQGGGTRASLYENNTCRGPMYYGIYNYIYPDSEGNVFQYNSFNDTEYGGIWQMGNASIRHNVFENVSVAGIWVCKDGGECAGSVANPTDLSFYNNTFTYDGGYLARFHSNNYENNTVIHHGNGQATQWAEHPTLGPFHTVWGEGYWLYKAQETIEKLEFVNTAGGTRYVNMTADGRVYPSRYVEFGTSDNATISVEGFIDKRGSLNPNDDAVGTFLWNLGPQATSIDVLATGVVHFVISGFLTNKEYVVTVFDYADSRNRIQNLSTDDEGSATFSVDFGSASSHSRISIREGEDVTAPAQILDLEVVTVGNDSVVLQWTAPGDDAAAGRASTYDLRYTTTGPLSAGNFDSATLTTAGPPQPAGTNETFKVTQLSPETEYWFTLRTADEVPNWSPVSNSPRALTIDATPPARVEDLEALIIGDTYTILQWSAPGDDGNQGRAGAFILRQSTSGPLDDANFESGTSVFLGSSGPAGMSESLNVTALSPETEYWFALRMADEVPNWSPVSNSVRVLTTQNNTVLDGEPPIVRFTYPSDGERVSGDVTVRVYATDDTGVDEVSIFVDDRLETTLIGSPYAWTWSTSSLSPGPYTLRAEATDATGNRGSHQISVDVESPLGPDVTPTAEIVSYSQLESRLSVRFSEPMNRASVEQAVSIEPEIPFQIEWEDDRNLNLILEGSLTEGVTYVLLINQTARDSEGISLAEGFSFGFRGAASMGDNQEAVNGWLWVFVTMGIGLVAISVLFFWNHPGLRTLRGGVRQLVRRLEDTAPPSEEADETPPLDEADDFRRY